MVLSNFRRITHRISRYCGNLANNSAKRSYDNYIIGAGLGSIVYLVTYSIYEAKAVVIRQYPPLPTNRLVRDNDAIYFLKNAYFSDINSIWLKPEVKMPVAIVGNLGSGKSILMYHLCSELYKAPRFYDIRLPSSKICVFLDMTNCDTFLESLRLFVYELNEKTRNKTVEPFHQDVIALEPYEQATKLLVHMYKILEDHSDWCIVLDNITPKSFNDMKHIFGNFFSLNLSATYSLSKIKGKVVYVCDTDFPLIENVNFYQYNELAKETAKNIVINQLAIPNINENDVSCLVDLLSGSPIALIAACYLVQDQLFKKRHISLKEAARTVATSISLLTDKLAKKQAIDITANNVSYAITMTTLTMMYKNYQLHHYIPYQLEVPFDVRRDREHLKNRAITALNSTYGHICEFFSNFRVGTKIPDTLLANFVNKYIHPIESEKIVELTQSPLLKNPTQDSERWFFKKYYDEYVTIKSDINEAIFGSKRKSFTQSSEKLNAVVEWIPFLRFQQYLQQRLVSIHPFVHESSKMLLRILVENNLDLPTENNESHQLKTSKSLVGSIYSYISPNSRSLDTSPTTFGLEKLKDVYQQLCFGVFQSEAILKLKKPSDNSFETYFMTYITNLIDSVTLAAPLRYGDCSYYTLKQISMIQRVLSLYFKNNDLGSTQLYYYRLQYYRCVRKIVELLLSLKQPKFVLQILTPDSMVVDCVCGIANRNSFSQEYANELTQVSILLAQSYVLLDKFDDAKQLLDRLWLIIDPSKNIHSNTRLCIHLLYVCCLLYDRMFDHYTHSLQPIKFVDEIFSYMVLVYNYQFQNTLLQTPIYDENEASFFIDIMLLFSNLCLKYQKVSYAIKFVKDADVLNKNVLKSGLTSIVSPYDQSITNMMIRCYEFQGNQPMVNKLKASFPTNTVTST